MHRNPSNSDPCRPVLIAAASALLLAGCATSLPPAAVIRYRQIGACDGTADFKAGPNAAFVLFDIDSIRNENAAAFAFDPTKLFVTGTSPQPLGTPSQLLGILQAGSVSAKTIPGGQQLDFPPASFGVVKVATTAASGAAEANRERFFLNYQAGPADPPVLFEKLDLARTAWPATSNCTDIRTALGHFAYVHQLGVMSTLKIDPTTGAVADLGGAVPGLSSLSDPDPGEMAFDPRGHFLIAVDSNLGELRTYNIRATDGALDPVSSAAAPTRTGPFKPLIDPSGRFAYVQTVEGIDAFSLDLTTGHPTSAGHVDLQGVESIVVDGSGRYLYVLASDLGETIAVYTIDQSTGALGALQNSTPLKVSAFGGGLDFMAINPASGYLYLSDKHAGTIRAFTFDPTKSALTEAPVAAVPVTGGAYSITFDPGGGFAFTETGGSGLSVFSVSATGALTPAPTLMNVSPQGVASEPTGRFLYLWNAPTLTLISYRLNSKTGALTPLPGTPPVVKGAINIPGTY